jgi:HSP20 family protein
MSLKDLMRRRHADEDLPLMNLQNEMNRLFEEFASGWDLAPFGHLGGNGGGFRPKVNVAETDTAVKVTAELPGLEEKDIEVSLDDNVLTIRGERKEETEKKGEGFYVKESSYGKFERRVPLPVDVESDKVDATYKKGVLTVSLPKSAKAKDARKKIPVLAK